MSDPSWPAEGQPAPDFASTFLIDPKGIVRRTWPQVGKAAGHAATVLAALKQLAGG
jgi:peroxiredoxin